MFNEKKSVFSNLKLKNRFLYYFFNYKVNLNQEK